MLTKKQWITEFLNSLEFEIQILKNAALATREAATNEESKPENQYDTRALEASYLAGAQAKRVNEIEALIQQFHTLKFKSFHSEDPIELTAIVDVNLDGKKRKFLVMPLGGGFSAQIDGESVQIVTPNSAMGEAIMGLSVGDSAEFEISGRPRTGLILNVQ